MSLFKQISTILFVGLILVRSMVIPMVFIDYELNKDYIIQNFCVNKNKPELECDGKCYLAQKINEAREKEAESTFSSYLFTMECHFVSQTIKLTYVPIVFFLESKPIDFKASIYDSKSIFAFFHPPRS